MTRFPRTLKIPLLAFGGLVAVVVLAALAVMFFVDVDAYKPRIEAEASRMLAMEVAVEGPVRIGWTRGLHVALENVSIRNRGMQLAIVEEADLALALLPLLRQDLRYGDIALKRARISIERDRAGKYNYERSPDARAAFPALSLQKVSFTELIVAYRDRGSGDAFEARNCSGALTRVRHPGSGTFLSRLSLSGQFACSQLPAKKAPVSDIRFSVEATDGVFDFKPVTMRAFGGQGSGSLHIDHTGAIPAVHLEYSLRQFRIEEYFRTLLPGQSVSGQMDFSVTLSMRGRARGDLRRSAEGAMTLSGTNLTLAGADLDRDLSKYEASQRFNLFDLTAFVFAGPLGLAVTKGSELAMLAPQEGGSTQIRTVVSTWKVEKGVAHAKDVALATRENRLALHGGLDFVNDDFDDVVVALVDSKGCAKVRQRIRGPFSRPVVEKPGVMASITGPLRNLFGKPGQCEVFYSGSVAAPA